MITGEPSREAQLWAARRTIQQHREDPANWAGHPDAPRCARCKPDGSCVALRWAEAYVEWIREFVELNALTPAS